MSRYATKAEAESAGFSFEHSPADSRFILAHGDEVLGFARYSMRGKDTIDFDSTFVEPRMRDTGLSSLLVQAALGDSLVEGLKVKASCWYVDELIAKHPEYLADRATFIG